MVKSISEEPEVKVIRWGIMQDFSGYRLVGMYLIPGGGTGRVSSPITEFDEHAMMATTSSGRRYHLSGPPDENIAATLIKLHIRKWGLNIGDVAMAEPWEAALFCGSKLAGPKGIN